MQPQTSSLVSIFDRAFTAGREFRDAAGVIRTTGVETATVPLITGRIVACDPFYGLDASPFSEALPPGTYPVELCIAQVPPHAGNRVALARLRAGDDRAVSYELADPPRFGTDLACACFMDAAVSQALADLSDAENQGQYDGLIEALDKCPGHWLEASALGSPGLRFLVFEAGMGDGVYESYYGRNANGDLCGILLDFGLIPHPPEAKAPSGQKPWWRFW